MKHCRKMKQKYRACLGSMGRKRYTAWWRGPEERQHQGGKREETMLVGVTQILLGQKIKKIHRVDSAGTNGQ
jgi:hypothetical protein